MFKIYLILLLVLILIFIFLSINIYFLSFRLEKHPKIVDFIHKKLNEICENENIYVYNYSFKELNINIEDMNDSILGRYVYSKDIEHQKKIDEYSKIIKEVSIVDDKFKNYFKTNEIFKLLILPRIELCDAFDIEIFKLNGLNTYYSIFLHEIGHHFALKNIKEHSETDADYYAYQILKNDFPVFFRLIYKFKISHKLNNKLSTKEIIIGLFHFLKYLTTKKI